MTLVWSEKVGEVEEVARGCNCLGEQKVDSYYCLSIWIRSTGFYIYTYHSIMLLRTALVQYSAFVVSKRKQEFEMMMAT
jgi:hypothetical protein